MVLCFFFADPTKYFGCELGAQTQFDIKHDRYIVNGSHNSEKLQELLDGFIRKFVLCPECENPETVYSVHAKSGIIYNSCQACGYAGEKYEICWEQKIMYSIMINYGKFGILGCICHSTESSFTEPNMMALAQKHDGSNSLSSIF